MQGVDYAPGNGAHSLARYRGAMLQETTSRSVGDHLREWRQRRRMSQLDLASEAGVSTRHLSFVETGRSAPSREMVLMLAERLELPLRAQNQMLVAAGFAPRFSEKRFDDPDLAAQRTAVDLVLKGHAPNLALAIDAAWNLIAANDPAMKLLGGVAPKLFEGQPNVLRISLHPDGLAQRIVNIAEWRHHIFARLERQIEVTGDERLASLLEELRTYPAPPAPPPRGKVVAPVVTPLQLKTPLGVLSLFGTVTVFGTPQDVTLSEIMIESFFPADAESAALLAKLVG